MCGRSMTVYDLPRLPAFINGLGPTLSTHSADCPSIEFEAGGFDAPLIVAKGNNHIALGHDVARLKAQRLLVRADQREELADAGARSARSRERDVFNFREFPFNVV